MQIKQIKQFIIILNDKNNSSFFDINDKSTLKIADHILKKIQAGNQNTKYINTIYKQS